jgi:sialidase-1
MNRYSEHELIAFGAERPKIKLNPLPKYCMANQDYGMTIGVAVTRGGRIFVCWVGGGDNPKAYFLLSRSVDSAASFEEPCLVIDPHDDLLPCDRCTIVGTLWVDPKNRLWLFFNQTLEHYDGTSTNWYIRCDNPDADELVWTEPQYVYYGCTLNKPVVLDNGEWLLPISVWARYHISKSMPQGIRRDLDDMRMAHVFVSSDEGETWTRRGGVVFPDTCFDEHMFVQLSDGCLWMLGRTRTNGLWQTFSSDRGAGWTEPERALVQSVSARFHLRKLRSGRILLIKHGQEVEKAAPDRSWLTAFLSDDDGDTWSKGFVLDERCQVSYPDSDQDADGNLYITYDRNRIEDGEIIMACLREEDIIAGKLVTQGSFLKRVVRKPGKLIRTQESWDMK